MFQEVENGDTVTAALDAFDNMLDEMHSGVWGIAPSRIMRECDPIMYRCEFYDWLDSEGVDSDTLTGDDDRLK